MNEITEDLWRTYLGIEERNQTTDRRGSRFRMLRCLRRTLYRMRTQGTGPKFMRMGLDGGQ